MTMKCIPDQHDLQYVWEKRNDNLPPRAQGVHSSTLTIINLKPEDFGEYRCIVSNSTGRIVSKYLPVTVKGVYICNVNCEPLRYCTSLTKLPTFHFIQFHYQR